MINDKCEMTGLADCNNFFVSCERVANPALEGCPVIVMSNNDGCVVARSNEAKRMGIKMGQPVFEIRDLIESGQLTAIPGNHKLYKEISVQVHDILRKYAPATIDYSIDESFLDMRGIPVSVLQDIGEHIVADCRDSVGIPVTVGFAATKTLAKVITDVCKKRGDAVGVLYDNNEVSSLLSALPIQELWGVGRRMSKKMYVDGIHTVWDFAQRDKVWVKSRYGINGERSWLELHGVGCITLSRISRMQESISESRTFPTDTDDYSYIEAQVAQYAVHCSQRLREMSGLCHELTVTLSTNRFHTEQGYFAPQISAIFDKPVNDTMNIKRAAIAALQRIYSPGMQYKRAMVVLTDIMPSEDYTPSLFEFGDGPFTIRSIKSDI